MRSTPWKPRYDASRIFNQLSLYIIMDVNRVITFLPKVNV